MFCERRPLDERKKLQKKKLPHKKSFVWIQRPLNKDAVGMQSVAHKRETERLSVGKPSCTQGRVVRGGGAYPRYKWAKGREETDTCGRSRRERAAPPGIQIMQLIITPSIHPSSSHPPIIHPSALLLQSGAAAGRFIAGPHTEGRTSIHTHFHTCRQSGETDRSCSCPFISWI